MNYKARAKIVGVLKIGSRIQRTSYYALIPFSSFVIICCYYSLVVSIRFTGK